MFCVLVFFGLFGFCFLFFLEISLKCAVHLDTKWNYRLHSLLRQIDKETVCLNSLTHSIYLHTHTYIYKCVCMYKIRLCFPSMLCTQKCLNANMHVKITILQLAVMVQ